VSLRPRDMQLFLKRLRRNLPGRLVRYFGVGEYGDESWRPHFHLVLFGVGLEEETVIQKSWGMGYICVQEAAWETIQYTVGYVVKKLTKFNDPLLAGRFPEFARMSLRPGIGAGATSVIASRLFDAPAATLIANTGDVPSVLRSGRKSLPLGRYLTRCLRSNYGGDPETPKTVPPALQKKREEMYALRQACGSHPVFKVLKPFIDHQRIHNAENRAKIQASRGRKL